MRILQEKIVAVLLSAAALTGCMVGPDFHSPAAPKTTHYTKGSLLEKTVSTPQAGDAGKSQYFIANRDIPAEWWRVFHSSELNELIEKGIANSPNLAAAQAALSQAQEALTAQIGTTLYPSVSANLAAQRQSFSASSLGTDSTSIFNFYSTTMAASYALDMFGGLRRQIEALRDQVNYQAFQLEAAYLALTSNIATTAITAASLRAQIEATHELIHLQEKQLTIVKQQFNAGAATQANVYTQLSQLEQTRASLPPLEQNLAKTEHALSVLVGELPSENHLPIFNLKKFNLPANLPISVPSLLVRQRPDIRSSEELLAAASAQVGVATANLYPQITLNASYGYQSTSTGDFFSRANKVWSLSGNLMQPIFNGGALRAQKRAAVDAYQQALAQYEQTVLTAFQNVADNLRALQNDAQTFRAQKAAEVASYRAYILTQDQYRLGSVSYVSLLTAQQQYQQAKILSIQAQAARYNDTALLFQALGGGWWNRGKLATVAVKAI